MPFSTGGAKIPVRPFWHRRGYPELLPYLSLNLVPKFFCHLFSKPVIGNFIKTYFAVRELARRLEGLYYLIHALVGRHTTAADSLSIDGICILGDIAVDLQKT